MNQMTVISICVKNYKEVADELIKTNKLVLHNNLLRVCYSSTGEIYCIPVYVVNKPLKYDAGNTQKKEEVSNVAEEKLQVKPKFLKK